MTKLQEAGFTHCLVDNDIHDLAHSLAVGSIWIVDVGRIDRVLSFVIYFYLDGCTCPLCVKVVSFSDLLSRPDALSMLHVCAKDNFELLLELGHNLFELECGVLESLVHLLAGFDSERVLVHHWAPLTNLHQELVRRKTNLLGFGFLRVH